MFNQPTLVGIDTVAPADYNPRRLDRERLELIKLSLSRLGFLLPIYATNKRELLSGHQRRLAASELGFTQVPVVYIDDAKIESRAVNIVFNRGTNDFAKAQSSQAVFSSLLQGTVEKLMAAPVLEGDARFPCMTAKPTPLADLIAANNPSISQCKYQYNLARNLYKFGVLMPVVTRKNLMAVNGIGRIILGATKGLDTIDVVAVEDWVADLAEQCLNCLTMDFTIHEQYEDILRYNSFRRKVSVRKELGRGFVFATIGSKPSRELDLSNPTHRAKYTSIHGSRFLDFGAGHLTETNILKAHGFSVTPFEPYRIKYGTQAVDKRESVELTREFLAEVEAGVEWDSIFISSVLNSVPFESDRQHISCITAALASPKTKLFAAALSFERLRAELVEGFVSTSSRDASSVAFALDYEPGIRLGDLSALPKVQKYHTSAEFKDLFSLFWKTVKVARSVGNIEATCTNPMAPTPERLAAAIEFEFDLPYPDGSRMGLVGVAKSAFSKRLGLKL